MKYHETLSQFIQPCKSRGFLLYEGMWKMFEGIVLADSFNDAGLCLIPLLWHFTAQIFIHMEVK
jgi:hypothetical protein